MRQAAEDCCALWHKPFEFLVLLFSIKIFFYLNGLLNILQVKENRKILRQYFDWIMKYTWPVRTLSTVKTGVQRTAAAV